MHMWRYVMEYDTKKAKGKGGNIKTERNLWNTQGGKVGPDLSECQSFNSVIEKVLAAGCAIIIGRTRDGGSNVLTVLDGDNRHRTYCSTVDEFDDAMRVLDNMFSEP
jgi:hypothetical protein